MKNKHISGDISLVKKLNKRAVLTIIKEFGPLSRTSIAKKARLNKATVSTLVHELLEIDIIKEIGIGKSTGGRRPILIMINDDSGCIIGVDLQPGHLSILLTNLSNRVIWHKKTPIKINDSTEYIFSQMEDLINKAIENSPETSLGILGVGIGVPGIVDYRKSELLIAPNLNWHNLNLKSYFEDKINLPIFIDNEANVAALAEQLYGNHINSNSLIYISAGTGIGVGLILNGALYRGSKGYSGEFGHMSIERFGLKCPCGNQGCWEMYASEKSFMREIKKDNKYNDKSFSDYMSEDSLKSHEVIGQLNEVGINLGIGISNIINSFNPEVIIIGNTLAQAGNLILNPIIETVESRLINYINHEVDIKLSTLGEESRALGAASMVLSNLLNDYSSDIFN